MNSGINNISPSAASISPNVKAEIWYTKDPQDFFRINQGQQPHPELYTKQHELEIPAGIFGHNMLEHVFEKMNLEKPEGLRSMSIGDVVVVCIGCQAATGAARIRACWHRSRRLSVQTCRMAARNLG